MNITFEIDKDKNVALLKESDKPLTIKDVDLILATLLGITAFNYKRQNISYEEFCNHTQEKINIFNNTIKKLFNESEAKNAN